MKRTGLKRVVIPESKEHRELVCKKEREREREDKERVNARERQLERVEFEPFGKVRLQFSLQLFSAQEKVAERCFLTRTSLSW